MSRPELEVADIFRRFGAGWRAANEAHISLTQRRVMTAIEICRTAALGGHVERCEDCAHTRIAYNSCRNRHCPKCQWRAAQAWLEAREAELLPVPYFHVVFTLPAPVAEIAFQNKETVYAILFRTAAETLRTIAADPRHLGAEIGLVAVLHTWGQNLHHHPHVHCVVPGGGPSLDHTRWVACRPGFFLPVRALSRLFRRLFLDELRAAFAAGDLVFFGELAKLGEPAAFTRRLRELRRVEWVVYAKPPFGGPARDCQEFRARLSGLTDQSMAAVKRSPKRTANCDLAMDHSRGGMIHSFSERFKTRKRSLVAASSLGKWPLARTARRSLAFSASIAFVV